MSRRDFEMLRALALLGKKRWGKFNICDPQRRYIQGLVTVLCGFCFASRTGFGTARSECESEIVWLGVWARAIQRPTLVGSCQGRISASSAARRTILWRALLSSSFCHVLTLFICTFICACHKTLRLCTNLTLFRSHSRSTSFIPMI